MHWIDYQSNMCLALVALLLLFVLQVASLSSDVSVAKTETADDEVFRVHLSTLTDHELEQLCVDRGLGSVKEEMEKETGELVALTREHYIELAQLCLNIADQT